MKKIYSLQYDNVHASERSHFYVENLENKKEKLYFTL